MLGCALALAPATQAGAAQTSYTQYDETPAAALARDIRSLASDPKDFGALIGAGKAALALGDAQAAAGFFARADEVNPTSPLPQAGMGAVAVANGDPRAAMPYFARAQKLGLPVTTFACDRGLAYDLLGQQAQAQADYRVALNGPDADEARRRLALSLAIAGNQAAALDTLAPLTAKADPASNRVRAFVFALTGNSNGAMQAADAALPGSFARVAPFLQRLPTLKPGEKAAAVNLGIFPDSNDTAYAYAAPVPAYAAPPTASSVTVSTDTRIAAVDQLLRPSAPAAPSPPVYQPQPQQPLAQIAYNLPVTRQTIAQSQPATAAHKIWLQLASGSNADALPHEFQRIKSKDRDLFDGITGYVARGPDRARLLIGPFHSAADADTFAEDLQSLDVAAFKWSNSESDEIVPLASE
jgi:Flp pilus assembly protein TadD